VTPLISVLLPTIRQDRFRRSFDSIHPAAGTVPYEVIIVADFESEALDCVAPEKHLHCRWIVRERRGVVDAVNAAYQAARGEYLFLFNDESILEPGALEFLYDAAVERPGTIVSPLHLPAFPFVYYGQPFVPFPFAHRDTFAQLGGMLDPAYKGFYADPDLSLRAHARGVPIHTVETAILHHTNVHDERHHEALGRYFERDRATFRARWDHLGAFADP